MTTTCGRDPTQLVELLEDGAGSGRSTEIREHLQHCSRCEGELRELRRAWEALPASVAVEPPARIREGVFSRAREAVEVRS